MTDQVTPNTRNAEVAETLHTLADKLAELGDTPDAIADRLRALGVKGKRRAPGHCPIARLINTTVDGVTDAAVFGHLISYFDADDQRQDALTNSPIAEFVKRFDQGIYLDLVEVRA